MKVSTTNMLNPLLFTCAVKIIFIKERWEDLDVE